MTSSPLREFAAEMRGRAFWFLDETLQREVMRAWADKLESLAGEYAVVPREPTVAMLEVFKSYQIHQWSSSRAAYRAMIEAAERQETWR